MSELIFDKTHTLLGYEAGYYATVVIFLRTVLETDVETFFLVKINNNYILRVGD